MREVLIVYVFVATGYLAVQSGKRGRFRKQILAFVSICYAAGSIYYTFLSRSPGHSRINLMPFLFIFRSLRYPVERGNIWPAVRSGQWEKIFTTLSPIKSAILNVFLFIPFGFLLPEWKKQMTVRQVLAAGFTISCLIEVIQAVSGIGWFDIDDLLCNYTGSVLGILLYKAGSRPVRGTGNE